MKSTEGDSQVCCSNLTDATKSEKSLLYSCRHAMFQTRQFSIRNINKVPDPAFHECVWVIRCLCFSCPQEGTLSRYVLAYVDDKCTSL